MSELYAKVGEVSYANLLADPQGADKISIPMEPKKGVINAGTIVYRGSAGLWIAAASAQITAANQLAVLKETVDTGTTDVAEDALAYRAGCFITGAVTLAAGAEVTEAHKAVLRAQGIVFDRKEATATFKNNVTA